MRLLSVGQGERIYHNGEQETSKIWLSQIGKCIQQNQSSQVTSSLEISYRKSSWQLDSAEVRRVAIRLTVVNEAEEDSENSQLVHSFHPQASDVRPILMPT